MSENNLPAGPSEAEVREHFGDKIPPGTKLMRPAYTSIWALEDGTLLWDWRNGFSDSKPRAPKPESKLKCIMYVTGPQGSGKSTLIRMMHNTVEVGVNTVNSRLESNVLAKIEANVLAETIAFSEHRYSHATEAQLKRIAEEFGIKFLSINITHN